MNETTNINSELLSADARGRKHVPLAVLIVILVHVVLFLVLLVAAGCRAKARARKSAEPSPHLMAQQKPVLLAPAQMMSTNPPPAATSSPAPSVSATVEATEPAVENSGPETPVVPSSARNPAPRISPGSSRPAAAARKPMIYIVKAGDTMEKIARLHRTSVEAIKAENNLKNHVLRPGQQLRVSTQKPKRSNEV